MKKDKGFKSDENILEQIRDLLRIIIRENRRQYRAAAPHVSTYTPLEVQDKYGIGERQLFRWIKEGKIPVVKKGKKNYFPKRLIDKFFEGEE